MEMEVEARCVAAYGERDPARSTSRIGYRDRAGKLAQAHRAEDPS